MSAAKGRRDDRAVVSERELREVARRYAAGRFPGWKYAVLIIRPGDGLPQESVVVVPDGGSLSPCPSGGPRSS